MRETSVIDEALMQENELRGSQAPEVIESLVDMLVGEQLPRIC